MDLETARAIVTEIESTSLESLRRDLVRAAVRYAAIRAEWALADREQRRGMDSRRTAAHDVLIGACDILSRNMAARGESVSWRERLGHDRREIGDFACHLHLLLGLTAR